MQIGFFAVDIGPSANPELLAARAIEQCWFHSLWTGEHVVLVSQSASKYPYAQDGRMPLPTTKIDFLDPFATLTSPPPIATPSGWAPAFALYSSIILLS